MADRETDEGASDYRSRRPLTQQQIAFADHYARGMTAAEAARSAGYAPRSAKEQGRRLLKTQRVRELIKAKREVLERASLVTAADIVDQLWLEAQNPGNKGFEKIKALELLGRALGLFRENGTPSTTAPPVQVYLPDNGRPALVEVVPVRDADTG